MYVHRVQGKQQARSAQNEMFLSETFYFADAVMYLKNKEWYIYVCVIIAYIYIYMLNIILIPSIE